MNGREEEEFPTNEIGRVSGLPPKAWTLGSWFERKEEMQTDTEERNPGKEKPYTEEFKRSVVTHWLESGKPARKVAEEFGIKQWNLRDWRVKFGAGPQGAEGGGGGKPGGVGSGGRPLGVGGGGG